MRKIKFRAWDNKEKVMIQEALLIGDVRYSKGSVVVDGSTRLGNELDWMQFTGLLDKNGKEIFEGDIVKCDNGGSVYETIEVVEFKEGGFNPFAVAGWEGVPNPDTVEVIGNIYQNPELLTN